MNPFNILSICPIDIVQRLAITALQFILSFVEQCYGIRWNIQKAHKMHIQRIYEYIVQNTDMVAVCIHFKCDTNYT